MVCLLSNVSIILPWSYKVTEVCIFAFRPCFSYSELDQVDCKKAVNTPHCCCTLNDDTFTFSSSLLSWCKLKPYIVLAHIWASSWFFKYAVENHPVVCQQQRLTIMNILPKNWKYEQKWTVPQCSCKEATYLSMKNIKCFVGECIVHEIPQLHFSQEALAGPPWQSDPWQLYVLTQVSNSFLLFFFLLQPSMALFMTLI